MTVGTWKWPGGFYEEPHFTMGNLGLGWGLKFLDSAKRHSTAKFGRINRLAYVPLAVF